MVFSTSLHMRKVFIFMLEGNAVYIFVSIARQNLLKKGTISLYRTFVQISRRHPFLQVDVGLTFSLDFSPYSCSWLNGLGQFSTCTTVHGSPALKNEGPVLHFGLYSPYSPVSR